ncbi:MAG: DUF1538 domain-containing protein [Spirochaetaceae bacterium]|jgi:hypothetical protein|nr:DUF1538 domain-containing protein [Spirochaetaceae bacterium]
MNLVEKFRETVMSVVPIMLIVIALGLTIAPIGGALLGQFVIGGVLLILGLSFFLLGVDICVRPVGELVGAALTNRRNLALLLIVSVVTGFLVTIAEPDVSVLADQMTAFNPSVHRMSLLFVIATGVGLFIGLGLLRTVLGWSYRILLIILYTVVFFVAFNTPGEFLSVGFDAGGATTGPMCVPFIIALGVGVAAVRGGTGKDNSFGLTGIASIGPVLAVLLFGMLSAGRTAAPPDMPSVPLPVPETVIAGIPGVFAHLIPEVFREVCTALSPLVALILAFQLTLLHLPPMRLFRIAVGFIYNFIGLNLFLVGVKGGFVPAGNRLGQELGALAVTSPGMMVLLVVLGAILGAMVVIAEPAIWVLTDEVEQISGGAIKRKVLLTTLSVGVAAAVALSMLRVLGGYDLLRVFLLPGYGLALLLTFFCPKLFVAIAFDSGGVATGPMTTTFILALTLGVSVASGGDPVTDAFGVISLVSMIPLIAIQILGLLYKSPQIQGRAAA